MEQSPKWLLWLERRIGWIAVPNIAILFITLQVLGFILVLSNREWAGLLYLDPNLVLQGEVWRVVTFLSLPMTLSPIWVLIVLWFLYFILSTVESQWGAFKTTFYILVSLVLTIAYSLGVGYPVANVSHFESTLFLAAAALFPEMEIRLFLIFPVKMKWMAWFAIGFALYEFAQGSWYTRGYLIAIYSNCLLFFLPAYVGVFKNMRRRAKFKANFK